MERVELRRTMRAAMIIQRWYRGWVQARLAATDDLYAFLRKEGLLEFEPALRCAFSSVALPFVAYREWLSSESLPQGGVCGPADPEGAACRGPAAVWAGDGARATHRQCPLAAPHRGSSCRRETEHWTCRLSRLCRVALTYLSGLAQVRRMEKDGVALDWMKRRIAVNDRATVRTSSALHACRS